MANKRTLGGSFSTAVGVFMAVIQVVHPEWLGNHSWILPICFVWVAVSALMLLGQYRWFQRLLGMSPAEFSQSEPNSANQVGRDNSGRMLSAGVIQNYHEAPSTLTTEPSISSDEIEAQPFVAFEARVDWLELVYEMSPGYWKEATQSDYAKKPRKSLLVTFARQVPPKGESHTDITLVAIVKFKHGINSGYQLAHPYWLGLTHHQVTFGVGSQSSVIVGSLEEGLFTSYQNKYPDDGSTNYFAVPSRELGARTTIPARNTISVEVSLFDFYGKRTIEQKQFDIIFSPITPPIIFEYAD